MSKQEVAAVRDEELVDRLRTVVLKLSRHLRRDAQEANLSVVDSQVLGHIYRRPGIGVSALATLERTSSPTMSVHVKRLIESGWVARQEQAADRDQRRVGLSLTSVGWEALLEIRKQQSAWLIAQLGELSALDRSQISGVIARLEGVLSE